MGEDHFLNLQPGTIVNGRYEIVKCLGTGSMGMVYACRHRELAGHLVAMKVLFAEVARDDTAAARFRNEIVASYGVNHPNVVRAYEYFRDGDLIAFTMEYIGGGDLADRLNADEPISIAEIARMLQQMCSGVQAIHDAGIIHRDLKPENILISSQGDIKITDFGIARTHTGPKLTEHGGVVGTIDYVSPEYLERGQVDVRSDIYALGVLAYEMITGEAPFKGDSVIATMTLRLKTDPRPPEELRSDCPIGLSQIVLHAMARDPENRYQSAAEMYRDLTAPDLLESSKSRSKSIERKQEVKADSKSKIKKINGVRRESEVHSQRESLEDTMLAGTVTIGADALNESVSERRTSGFAFAPEDYNYVTPMESVLRVDDLRYGKLLGGADDDKPVPAIAVSSAALSTERINQLFLDIKNERQKQISLVDVIVWILIISLVLGAGVFCVYYFNPDFFNELQKQNFYSDNIKKLFY